MLRKKSLRDNYELPILGLSSWNRKFSFWLMSLNFNFVHWSLYSADVQTVIMHEHAPVQQEGLKNFPKEIIVEGGGTQTFHPP